MNLLDSQAFRAYIGRKTLCEVKTSEKRLALTFDDGPHPRHTPRLLEVLSARGIRATFFLVGRRVRRYADLVERIAREGHEIGNHGDHHVPLTLLPTPLVRREITVTERLITDAAGVRPRLLRPPMGWFNDRVIAVARALGYLPVVGSVHPQDSRKPGTGVILERLRRRIEPGAIIILHDGGWWMGVDRSQTIEATDRIAGELLDQGYRFDTVSELAKGCVDARV